MDVDAKILQLELVLKKLEAMKDFVEKSESGCASCDFAVASSMVAYCYDDEEEGDKRRDEFLKGNITFGELYSGANRDREDRKNIIDFVDKRFKDVMDTYFDEWQDL